MSLKRVYTLINHSITGYIIIEDNAILCDFVRSSSECESAAEELGLSDITVVNDGQNGVTYDPPFCYFEGGSLKFNDFGTNTGACDAMDLCLCRQNDFCAKTPCNEGQGDCDDDTECEGSLVCGHLNCMNNTVSDCCTKPCNNDSDCASGECNAEYNECRLNSDTIDWSRCSQDSPCANGEGDCDHHTDCEGKNFCGNDNCASGPTGMDCCEGNGNLA